MICESPLSCLYKNEIRMLTILHRACTMEARLRQGFLPYLPRVPTGPAGKVRRFFGVRYARRKVSLVVIRRHPAKTGDWKRLPPAVKSKDKSSFFGAALLYVLESGCFQSLDIAFIETTGGWNMHLGTSRKQRVILLGCSGSIGTTALRGLESMRDYFEIVGISAHSDIRRLTEISFAWNVRNICITSPSIGVDRLGSVPNHVRLFHGQKGLLKMIRETDADVVLNGIAGTSGLLPTFAALESKKDVALANKESIIMAGSLLFHEAKKHGCSVHFVDSEHSALKKLVDAHGLQAVKTLVLTASGGPFREFPRHRMDEITPEMAVAHPTWRMGAKISVDSATMANKGLEVIEASYLFGFPAESIEVVIHPQSIIHSMIRLKDGAVYAQMSKPDMVLPIMSALSRSSFPLEDVVTPLDFTQLDLSFSQPDTHRFPLLAHAFDCARSKGSYVIAFNAANEVAVYAFLAGRISFLDINRIVEGTLQQSWGRACETLEDVLETDALAKDIASEQLSRIVGSRKRVAL